MTVENMELQVLALYEDLETEFNNPNYSQDVADEIQNEIAKLNKAINELLFPTQKSVIEKIAEQLFEQGYYSENFENKSLTVTGMDYDLSITVLENGFSVETYNSNSVEQFRTYEWANSKVVKTVRGLNGYMKKFGFGQVTL